MLRRAAALSAVVGCAFAQSETNGPLLVVHKTLDSDSAVAQRNLTVTVAVYNHGSAAAFDVSLVDVWPLDAIGGEKEQKWDQIEANGNVTHSFTLLPGSDSDTIETQPAKVTFGAAPKSEERRTATSNDLIDIIYSGRPDERMQQPRNIIPVISAEEYDRQSSRRVKEWATFLLLLVIPVIMPAYFWKVSANSLTKKREDAKAAAKEDQKASKEKAGKSGGGRRSSGKSGGKK